MKNNDLLILGGLAAAFFLFKGKGADILGGDGGTQFIGSPFGSQQQVDYPQYGSSSAADQALAESVPPGAPLGFGQLFVAGFKDKGYNAVSVDASQLTDPNSYAQLGGGLVVDKTTGVIKFVGGGFAGFAGINVPINATPGQKKGELVPASFEDPLVLKSNAAAYGGSKSSGSKSKSKPSKNNLAFQPAVAGVNYSPASNYSKACTYTKPDGTCG